MRVCLVGCGGMGWRHVRGYHRLARMSRSNVDLVAVCDVREDQAAALAYEVEQGLGLAPRVFTRLDDVLADADIEALDVVTDPSTHHVVAVPALESGRHVLCEKPLGLTVRACRRMIDAAHRSGAVLATAENYRRGGANRLARLVLEDGLLGDIHLMIEMHLGGDDTVMMSPWRHRKERGSIALDMGVHLTDIVQYLLGDFATIYGRGLIAEPTRRVVTGPEAGLRIKATGEDSLLAQFHMACGATVQLSYLPSGPGYQYHQRTLHGRAGSMTVSPDRSGGEVEVRVDGRVLRGGDLEAALSASAVDDVTSAVFGSRSASYDLPFALSDAAHIAVELQDFARAVVDGGSAEVDGERGLRAVAAVHSVFESDLAGRPLHIDEVASGAVSAYQDDIDRSLGLLAA